MRRVAILGGTGTLGQELAKSLSTRPVEIVRIFSRDELKQKKMAAEFGTDKRFQFVLGDIRDEKSCYKAVSGMDTVFHVAALKHIDAVEENPEESIKTNILGTVNVADAAEAWGVKHVIFSSTDKAVDPINVYGMSKAISERLLLRRNESQSQTKYCIYRWGNVLGSRGSVIPKFAQDLKAGNPISLTHPQMSRFWIPIADAVDFMLKTYEACPRDQVNIPPIKAASLVEVVQALAQVSGVNHYTTEVTGIRRGEKLHEALTSWHSGAPFMSSDSWDKLTRAELVAMLEPLVRGQA